jgi:hypothetical protein
MVRSRLFHAVVVAGAALGASVLACSSATEPLPSTPRETSQPPAGEGSVTEATPDSPEPQGGGHVEGGSDAPAPHPTGDASPDVVDAGKADAGMDATVDATDDADAGWHPTK